MATTNDKKVDTLLSGKETLATLSFTHSSLLGGVCETHTAFPLIKQVPQKFHLIIRVLRRVCKKMLVSLLWGIGFQSQL